MLKLAIVILILQGVHHGTLASICVPIEQCECSEAVKSVVSCYFNTPDWDIKAAFQAAAHLVHPSTVFDGLSIGENEFLTKIPSGTFDGYRFKSIDFHRNANLANFSVDAFNATFSDTTNLYFWTTKLSDPNIFNFINRFENLEFVQFASNQLTSIPDRAFGNHPKVVTLDMVGNPIRSIGSEVFAGLTTVTYVNLLDNYFPPHKISVDSFHGLTNQTVLKLDLTGIGFLDREIVEPILDTVGSLVTGYFSCGIGVPCYYTHIYECDSRSEWVCERMDEFRPKLRGFFCDKNGNDIFDYCEGKPQ